MLLKALYKTIRGIFSGDGHKDEIIVSIWEIAIVILVACVMMYWVVFDPWFFDSNTF